MNIDDKDKVILTMYSKNPNVSQDEVAGELRLSQPAVASRLRKLKKMGAIEMQTGIDPFKLELHMAKVDLTTTDPAKVMDLFMVCPYFMNGFIVSGKNNLTLFFVAEKISTLESIVDGHLRKMPEIKDVDFNIAISPAKKVVMPVDLTQHTKKGKHEPCVPHSTCLECNSYKTGRCTGCPIALNKEEWFF